MKTALDRVALIAAVAIIVIFALADDQHAQQQLGIDPRVAEMAVIGPKLRPQFIKFKKAVDPPQQRIGGHVIVRAKVVEQRRRFSLFPASARRSSRAATSRQRPAAPLRRHRRDRKRQQPHSRAAPSTM